MNIKCINTLPLSLSLLGICVILSSHNAAWAAVTVGYYTDYNSSSHGPAAPITTAGATPVAISNISSFAFNSVNILMIDESNNGGISPSLLARANDLTTYVLAGGVVIEHDRYAGDNHIIPGGSDISLTRAVSNDLQVVSGNNTVIAGPYGTVTNSNLDNGGSSSHGYASATTLPPGSTVFLSSGTAAAQAAAFSYPLGAGMVYYSTIPLDYFLDGGTPAAFRTIYTPNVITYARLSLPEPTGLAWFSVATVGISRRKRQSARAFRRIE